MRQDIREHYEGLAEAFDENWSYSPAYIRWMTQQISEALELTPTDLMADIGCGSGLYAREIARMLRPDLPLLCVDPSARMLRQVPDSPDLRLVQASLEDLAADRVNLPYTALDAVLVKDTIHHASDRAAAVAGLAHLLAPKGRLLIAMLPTTVEYPLFSAALKRYEELQPAPDDVASQMAAAGLRTTVWQVEHEIRMPTERYLRMIRSRYLSVLSTFSDHQIEDGIREIRARHPEAELVFPDRFVFLLGRKNDEPPQYGQDEAPGGAW